MGGGGHWPFPRYVWSPSGGFWATGGPNAARNAVFVFLGIMGLTFPITKYGESRTVTLKQLREAPGYGEPGYTHRGV
eukprot:tig00020554_g10846.t1